MTELGPERSTQADVAPVPSVSHGPGREPAPDRWGRSFWSVSIPLALIVIVAFLPAINNGFVTWDDDENFLENPYFRGLGAAEVKWAWTTFWVGAYQPLAWLLFETQYVFCQLDPHGYHFTSLLLYAVNAEVLYVLTVAILLRCRTDSGLEGPWLCSLSAGLATVLFAVHPLRVEVVAWASCQPYLPCAFFAMLTVLAYLRAFPKDSSRRSSWLVASWLLYVTAVLFKAVALSLAAVLLILDVYPLRRIPDATGRWFGPSAWRALWEKVPFVLTSILFMILAMAAKPHSRSTAQHDNVSAGVARACYAIWFYIQKTVLPVSLIPVYPLPPELNWLAPRFLSCILATLALTAGLFLMRARWPGLLAAWLSYLIILAPNSGIIRFNEQIAADRYSYISMLASVIVAAAFFCSLWQMLSRWRPVARIGVFAMSLGVLLTLIALTRLQCRTWLNSETLWFHAVAEGGKFNPLAHNDLGNVLYNQEKYGEAASHYREALRLFPGYANAHNNCGAVLLIQGKYDEAEMHFREALRLDPVNEKAYYNLGKIFALRRKYDVAEAHFTQALRLNPSFAEAHNNLGTILQNKGSIEAAAVQFANALRLNPDYVDAHNNLGIILLRQGKYAEAGARFSDAVRLDPGNVQAHYNLGRVFSHLGNFMAAGAQFAEAMRLQPDDAKAYNASAMLMAACPEAKFRDGRGAVKFATRACELTQWKNPIILDTLAAAQAEAGDFDAAVKAQQRAIALLPVEGRNDDYRSRLVLYQAKKPYRQPSQQLAPAPARP